MKQELYGHYQTRTDILVNRTGKYTKINHIRASYEGVTKMQKTSNGVPNCTPKTARLGKFNYQWVVILVMVIDGNVQIPPICSENCAYILPTFIVQINKLLQALLSSN